MSLRPTSRRIQSLKAYLDSMLCPVCGGKKCKTCEGKGTSKKFDRLMKKATEGIAKHG